MLLSIFTTIIIVIIILTRIVYYSIYTFESFAEADVEQHALSQFYSIRVVRASQTLYIVYNTQLIYYNIL